jgi:Asp-tRNA(Asn)/Glu-tRNA(Gln) amidotransferase A subunit family amidase
VDFRERSLVDWAGLVRSGEVRATELVETALERIESIDPVVNAFVALDADGALRAANVIDTRRSRGKELGDLAGIPFAVKDLEDAAGLPTAHGSAAFAGAPLATSDSALVGRLKDAGAIAVGKTSTPEFGWCPDTFSPTFGVTRNPWDPGRSPGGSSGGSAAAVAAGMVPLATGSDGGGSIRIPSAACGIAGFKPSLGRVPDAGVRAPGRGHLSSKGPMARTTADVAAALDAVLGPDPSDLRSLPMPEPSWLAAIDDARLPMKVAWSPTLGYGEVDHEVLAVCEAAVKVLESLGSEIVEIDGPFASDPLPAWMMLDNSYLWRTVTDAYGDDWSGLTPALGDQLRRAGLGSALDFIRAEDQCHALNRRLIELFRHVRLLVTPTTAAAPPLSGEPAVINGNATYNWVKFTYPFNLTRSPAGTLCAGLTASGLPVGLQLIGPQHGDLVVLRAMAAVEAALETPGLPQMG